MKHALKFALAATLSILGGNAYGQTIYSYCSHNSSYVTGYISNRSNQPVVVTGSFEVTGRYYDYDFESYRTSSDSKSVNQILYPNDRIHGDTIRFGYNEVGVGCDISTSSLRVRYLQPPTPVNVHVTHATEYSLSVAWQDGNSGELGASAYRVEISKAQSMSSTCSGSNSQNTGLFKQATFSNLDKGSRYYVAVCSFANNGQFQKSSILKTATIADPSPEVLGLSLVSEHPTTVSASWLTGAGSTIDYVYTLIQGSLPTATCSGGTVLTTTSLLKDKLTLNTNYALRVCSRNINETMTPGVTALVKTQDPNNILLPFTDSFKRSNSSTLGLGWELKGGSIGVRNDSAASLFKSTTVAVLKNLSASNVKVNALVDRAAGFSTRGVGLVVRHSIVGTSTNMYVAQIKKKGVNSVISIIAYVNSASTIIATKTLKGAEGNFEFDVQGTRMKVLLNGTVIHDITDTKITNSGSVGIATFGTGERLKNFSAK